MQFVQTIDKIEQIYDLVKSELLAVDGYVSDVLTGAQTVATKEICSYLLKTSGKRIRPLLTLLTARALQPDDISREQYQKLIQVSSAVELIHMASLVHDDVIDNSDTRRNEKSVRGVFGNSKAVAMGVYLYSISLREIAKSESILILSSLSLAVKGMCEGELDQLCIREEPHFSFDIYHKIITNKTAVLFQAACHCGSLLVDERSTYVERVKQFGHFLGMLFQLTDDYLDYFSDGVSLKKDVGQDYKDKRVTLPVLLYEALLDSAEKKEFKYLFQEDRLSFSEVLERLEDKGIQEKSRVYIADVQKQCKLQLDPLEESIYKLALFSLVDIVFSRIQA